MPALQTIRHSLWLSSPTPWLLSCPAADDYGARAQPRISAQVCGRGFQSRINPRGLTLTRHAPLQHAFVDRHRQRLPRPTDIASIDIALYDEKKPKDRHHALR